MTVRPAAPVLAAVVLFVTPSAAAGRQMSAEPADIYRVYTLGRAPGIVVRVTNYGARVLSIECPDRDGNRVNVALGHGAELSDWIDDVQGGRNPYFGAVVGRYGNRIADGEFELDGETYTLPRNNGPNSLHGGRVGFDSVRWEIVNEGEVTARAQLMAAMSAAEMALRKQLVEKFERDNANRDASVTFRLVSPDGDEGYPGELTATVTYLLEGDTLSVFYEATTTAPTVLNLTQHTYFNLKGEGAGDILGHELELIADRFTPVDDTLIPTGELRPVAGTPFDFRTPKPIGRDIAAENEQIKIGGGYDHNFVLNRGDAGPDQPTLAARVTEPLTGRVLEVKTTEPGVQLYTGNFLDGSILGTSGRPYTRRGAFCLETQHFPDSPNRPEFPSTVLRPGETYRSVTTFRFTTDTAE